MRNVAFLCLGVLLILVQANLYRLLGPLSPGMSDGWFAEVLRALTATPSLVLPLVLFLGVQEPSMARGSLLAFALGYLVDITASAPMFLFSFVSVSIWWLARTAGVRLTAQTSLTRIPLVFGFSLIESLIILVLLAVFGSDTQRPIELLSVVLPRALTTALYSPIVFRLAQRLHQNTAPARVTEGTAPR
jgi:rod shape-determining protein MreD